MSEFANAAESEFANAAENEFANAAERRFCERNARVAELARTQGGFVTRAQLEALGIRRGAVAARVGQGWLFRVHHGVYAVGHLPTNPLDRARGALLAGGPRSALWRRSAAAYWRLHHGWSTRIELISPLQRRIPGVTTSRCCTLLLARDVRTIDGIRVTSPARTMLDIAPLTYENTLHRYHNELRMKGLITNEQLIDVAVRNPRHAGAPLLLELAGAGDAEPDRSTLETDWRRFSNRFKLPPNEMNVHVNGPRVDVLFTPDRLIVELDGWGTHGTRHAFERDRDQDAEILAATGIPTMRITKRGLRAAPAKQARRIDAVLRRRP